MRRAGRLVGLTLVPLGLFWTGRESSNGLGAFWEHWWCPVPLVAILVGVLAVAAERLTTTP
jgi:hypothetical protein